MRDKKPNVLYLEDDENLGRVTADILSKKGFEVYHVINGNEGMKLIRQAGFDICIADVMLPGLDGFTLTKLIRQTNHSIPIILLSAKVLTEDVLMGFDVGADDYMRKPFNIEELISRMNRLLKRNNGINGYRVGLFHFNPSSFELKIKEKTILLSPRASELLFRMVTNDNNILHRQETLVELWGENNFYNGRSLDVFISKLRKHLSADESIRIINIRAQGYRLIFKNT